MEGWRERRGRVNQERVKEEFGLPHTLTLTPTDFSQGSNVASFEVEFMYIAA